MQVPLEIVFHNADRSLAVEADIRERTTKLEQLVPNITSCRVTVETPHRNHRQGNLYTVRIDVRVPAGETVASRSSSAHHAHEDIYVAVRDVFKAAQRGLQDRQRRRRSKGVRNASAVRIGDEGAESQQSGR